jgi:PAS domain S-box-containing protein
MHISVFGSLANLCIGFELISWNKAAERMFGYTAEEIVGKPTPILLPPDRLQEEGHILSRIRRGEKVPLHDSVRVANDGRLTIGAGIA